MAATAHIALMASTSGFSESFVYIEPFRVPPTYTWLWWGGGEVGKQSLRAERCSSPPTWKVVDSAVLARS